jgi:hypothetical protein
MRILCVFFITWFLGIRYTGKIIMTQLIVNNNVIIHALEKYIIEYVTKYIIYYKVNKIHMSSNINVNLKG